MTTRPRVEMPLWIRGVWGALLIALNVFMVVYVLGFMAFFVGFLSGGFSDSGLASAFSEGRSFGILFAVVALMILLSFAFMALSLVHILLWSGLSDDRKVVWAAVVFAGAQPGMLAYWIVNVRHRSQNATDRTERVIRDTPGRRVRLVVLAILTVLPAVYFLAFFGFVFTAIAGGFSGSSPKAAFVALPYAHLSVIVLMWTLTAIYLIDVFRTPRLEGWSRALWAAVVAFTGPLGWAIYWYMVMWREPPADSPTAVTEVSGGRVQA